MKNVMLVLVLYKALLRSDRSYELRDNSANPEDSPPAFFLSYLLFFFSYFPKNIQIDRDSRSLIETERSRSSGFIIVVFLISWLPR